MPPSSSPMQAVRTAWRAVGAAAVAFGLLLGGATAAQANSAPPTPDSGTGGTEVTVSVPLPSSNAYTQISSGRYSSVALTAQGRAWAWGNNMWGQLGNGTTQNSTTPVAVTMPAGVTFTQVSISYSHALAIGSDGKTYAWGNNSNWQLGDGTRTTRTTPVPVLMPAGVTSYTQVSAGEAHSLAIGNNGKTYAWGVNTSGNLGNGTTTQSISPIAVTMPPGVTSFPSISA